MTESLSDDPKDTGDYQYDDSDELYQSERIKQLLAARRRFREGRLGAREQKYQPGGITEADYRDVCAQLALDYVSELEPLIRRTDSNLLERVIETGPQEVETPNGDTTTVNPPDVTVAELLNAGGEIQAAYRYGYFDTSANAHKTDSKTIRVTVDANASQRLVRLCDDFLEDVMPVELNEQQQTKIDDDLIEEVDEWRADNL